MNIRRHISCFATFVLIASLASFGRPANAEPSISASVDYVSAYIWRGMDSHAEDDPAIQPDVTISLPRNWSFDIWASYGIDGGVNSNLDEVDFTIAKSGSFSPFIDWQAGYTYYTFHSVNQDEGVPCESQETFAGVSFPKLPLKPAINMYVDWETGDGVYASLTGTYEFRNAFFKNADPASLSVNLGYSDGPWGTLPGVSDITTSFSNPIKAGKFVITPSLNYSIAPDERVNVDDEIWLAVNVGIEL